MIVVLAAIALLGQKAPVTPYTEKIKPTARWKAGSGQTEMNISGDGATVVTVDPVSGAISTWSAATGKLVGVLGTDKDGHSPEMSADGSIVATFGKDQKLRL